MQDGNESHIFEPPKLGKEPMLDVMTELKRFDKTRNSILIQHTERKKLSLIYPIEPSDPPFYRMGMIEKEL